MWQALVCAFAPAHAEKRVALVIGSDRYPDIAANEQFRKAVNDARAGGGALRQIGFDVISGENLREEGRDWPAPAGPMGQRITTRPVATGFSWRRYVIGCADGGNAVVGSAAGK